MNNCFPEYCIRQLLSEYNFERGDDQIIGMIQNDLLPLIIMDILKSCITSAVCAKHKIITDYDIENALKISNFQTNVPPNKNHIIDNRHFAAVVNESINVFVHTLEKNAIQLDFVPKFSAASLATFQRVCESCIRTFVSNMKPFYSNLVNRGCFQTTITNVMGDMGIEGYVSYK